MLDQANCYLQTSRTVPPHALPEGSLGSSGRPDLVYHLSTVAQSQHSSAVRQGKGLPKTDCRLLFRGVNLPVAMGRRGMGMGPCSLQ